MKIDNVKATRHFLFSAVLASTAFFPIFSHAQATPAGTGAKSTAAVEMTEGEVRKVDKESRKITLKHGAIKNLDMPPMTMVFQVRDPAFLDKVKAGDKVRFTATDDAGKLTLTAIQSLK